MRLLTVVKVFMAASTTTALLVPYAGPMSVRLHVRVTTIARCNLHASVWASASAVNTSAFVIQDSRMIRSINYIRSLRRPLKLVCTGEQLPPAMVGTGGRSWRCRGQGIWQRAMADSRDRTNTVTFLTLFTVFFVCTAVPQASRAASFTSSASKPIEWAQLPSVVSWNMQNSAAPNLSDRDPQPPGTTPVSSFQGPFVSFNAVTNLLSDKTAWILENIEVVPSDECCPVTNDEEESCTAPSSNLADVLGNPQGKSHETSLPTDQACFEFFLCTTHALYTFFTHFDA